jgi:Glycosyl transferase family 2
MKKYAPVVVYTYNRLEHLKKTIAALKANHLAAETDIFVVSDGPKDEFANHKVSVLRDYIDSIEGFRNVNRIYHTDNVGVIQSVQIAEKLILSGYDQLITLEDDIVTSRNFLDFINAGLDFYEASEQAFTIAGYCPPVKIAQDYQFDSWSSPWHSPWGYGIWKSKYESIDVEFNPFQEIKRIKSKYDFLKKHGDFFIETLDHDARGLMIAGDARFAGQMLLKGSYTVIPCKSKVQNIGMDGSGVHCLPTERFDVDLDDGLQRVFKFAQDELDMTNQALKQYLQFMNGNFVNRFRRKMGRVVRRNDFLHALYRNVRAK